MMKGKSAGFKARKHGNIGTELLSALASKCSMERKENNNFYLLRKGIFQMRHELVIQPGSY